MERAGGKEQQNGILFSMLMDKPEHAHRRVRSNDRQREDIHPGIGAKRQPKTSY